MSRTHARYLCGALLATLLCCATVRAEYVLVTGNHGERQQAEQEAATWIDRGFPARTIAADADAGGRYRVEVGRYASEEAARQAGVVLIRDGQLTRFGIRALQEPALPAAVPAAQPVALPIGVGAGTCYSLHVSSYRTEHAAARDLALWRQRDQVGFSRREQVAGSSWHRVYLGPFESRARAGAVSAALQRGGQVSYVRLAATCPLPPPAAPELPVAAATEAPAAAASVAAVLPPAQEAEERAPVPPAPEAAVVATAAVAEEETAVPPAVAVQPGGAEAAPLPQPPAEETVSAATEVQAESEVAEVVPVQAPAPEEKPSPPPAPAVDSISEVLPPADAPAPSPVPAPDPSAVEPQPEPAVAQEQEQEQEQELEAALQVAPVVADPGGEPLRPEGPTVAQVLAAAERQGPAPEPSAPEPEVVAEAVPIPSGERFRLSLLGGLYVVTGTDEFDVEWMDGNVIRDAEIGSGPAPAIGVDAAMQLSRRLGLYASGSWTRGATVSLLTAASGVEYTLTRHWPIVPYLRAGALYGRFDWSEPPGTFAPTWGWEMGAGAHFPWRKVRLGGQVTYRSLRFEYDGGSVTGLNVSSDTLDLSGFHSVGSIGFSF